MFQITDDDDLEKATKLVQQASNILNNKTMTFEALVESFKKNKHYQKALKTTSSDLIGKMDDLKEKCKLYTIKGRSFQNMKAVINDVSEVLKQVGASTQLFRRL